MQDALPALNHSEPQPEREPYVPLPLRGHTVLGVCEAIGEDFGFNPLYLRVALAPLVLWDLKAAVGLYLALGLAVLLSRLLFPAERRSAEAVDARPAAPTADNEELDTARLAA